MSDWHFDKIVRSLRAGSIPDMRRVVISWPPPGSMSTILEAFLPHLSRPYPKDRDLQEDWTTRVILSLSALEQALSSKYPEEQTTEITRLVISDLDHILSISPWKLASATSQTCPDGALKTHLGLSLLYAMIVFNEALCDAVINHPGATEHLVPFLVRDEAFLGVLPDRELLLFVIGMILKSPGTRVLFFDSLPDLPRKSLDLFVSRVVSLTDFLKEATAGDLKDWTSMFAELNKVLYVLSTDHRFRSLLLRRRYLFRMVEAAFAFLKAKRSPEHTSFVCFSLAAIFKFPEEHSRHYLHLLAGLIDMGALDLVIAVVPKLKTEESAASIFAIIHRLLDFIGSHRVRRSMTKVLDRVKDLHVSDPSLPGWRGWGEFYTAYKRRLQSLEMNDGRSTSFCHNLTHHTINTVGRSGRHSAALKMCSGCAHIVYCSELCQRVDWKLVHKYECRSLVLALLESRQTVPRVPFDVVSHALLVVKYAFEAQGASGAAHALIKRHGSKLEAGHWVYVNENVDCLEKKHQIIPVSRYRSQLALYHPWFPARFDAAVNHVQKTQGTRLISVVFNYGFSKLPVLCIQGDYDRGQGPEYICVMAQIKNGTRPYMNH
ncbi:hypothetical protein BKA70DRAFT_1289985 [Coprinopsis sp. MPI-PUGE-AT-0042]|nr:hypothetical protein BKA70DRAFT_1289985 [Coprinopsis sp. MPI-PUGE-AT-0042]